MKFYNKENAYIQIGSRESVPPFGITRDFTEEEIQKIPELRYAIVDRKYLVPHDGKTPPAKTQKIPTKKSQWVTAPDTEGGDVVRKKMATGKVVEYVVADIEGVDDVQNADTASGLVASVKGQKPVDFIEEGVSGREADGSMKTSWRNASDIFEEELKKETTDELEVGDEDTLAEGEADRGEIPDADEAINNDYTQVLTDGGRMGATLQTVKEVVEDAAAKAASDIENVVRPDYDDGESVQDDSGVSKATAEFLAQPFFSKKWAISKTTDVSFLKEVGDITKSESVKSLVTQRLEEIEKSK